MSIHGRQLSARLNNDGANLRALRMLCGLSQVRLAELAGVGTHTVSRWEGKQVFQRQSNSLKKILSVLNRYRAGLTRARVYGVLRAHGIEQVQNTTLKSALRRQQQAQSDARKRMLCGAKTRKGSPCRLLSEPGKRRCKFHGGKSTGPKSAEGRQRIAEAQRRRWATYRLVPAVAK